MPEELKYAGSTKNDIWNAYKEKVAELKKIKEGEPASTVEKAKKETITRAIGTASVVNIEMVEKILKEYVEKISNLKIQYDDLVIAINAKKDELKEVHGIETSANALVALAAVKEQMVEEADEKAITIKKEADKIKEEADQYYQDSVGKARKDIDEIRANYHRDRERDEEEYEYNTKRQRQKAYDKVKDELETLEKSLNKREKEVKEREDLAEEKDTKIEELTETIDTLKSEAQAKEDAAFERGEEKAKKSAQVQANIIKTSVEANMKISQATINNLSEKIEKLEEQVEEANERVKEANREMAMMAQSALKAQGDVNTIGEISKIAAGSQKK